jgi:transposase-like protein
MSESPRETQKRRRITSAEKMKILKRHFVENQSVSSICEEEQIGPSQFYTWQRTLFEKGTEVFERNRGPKPGAESEEIAQLEKKVREKDEVIAELMAEYLKSKKKSGAAS